MSNSEPQVIVRAKRTHSMVNLRPPWKKGQSGNPSGRPRDPEAIQALARSYAPEAIARLITLMRSKTERIALAAAQALLDRGLGRPPSEHHGSPLVNLNFGSAGALRDAARLSPEETYRLMTEGLIPADPDHPAFRALEAPAAQATPTPSPEREPE